MRLAAWLRSVFCVVTCVGTQLSVYADAASLSQHLGELDEYARVGMREWNVPGMAIAVVRRDESQWIRTYGKSLTQRSQKITPSTLFPIGSLTKAMTATVLSELVDEELLSWDTPVRQFLPRFDVADPYANWDMRVRDLLTHNSGWAEHSADLLLIDTSHGMLLDRAEHIPTVSSFRADFAYQNLLYLAAGELIEALTKKPWEEQLKERLFLPLGMQSSHSHFATLALSANVAYPHVQLGEELRVVPWSEEIDFGAAGSVVSTIEDMSRWLNTLLQPASPALGTMQPQVYLEPDAFLDLLYPQARWVAYGMGWFIANYHGWRLIEHNGNIPGITAKIGLLPEQGVGIVILCNQEQSLLPHALMMRLFDQQLHLPQRDWSRSLQHSVRSSEQWKRQRLMHTKRQRVWQTKPSGDLGEFCGTFTHPLHGQLRITTQDGQLTAHLRGLAASLSHWHYDTWQVEWKRLIPKLYPGRVRLSFQRDGFGRVQRAELERLGSFTLAETERGPFAELHL